MSKNLEKYPHPAFYTAGVKKTNFGAKIRIFTRHFFIFLRNTQKLLVFAKHFFS